jgi:uncharacterized protein (DUF1778 family)
VKTNASRPGEPLTMAPPTDQKSVTDFYEEAAVKKARPIVASTTH